MECHSVRHIYRVDIREVWPSSWVTHGAQYEAVSCDYMDSKLACSYLWGDRLAMKDKQSNKTTIMKRGPRSDYKRHIRSSED